MSHAENSFNKIIEENIPNLKKEVSVYQGTRIPNTKLIGPEKEFLST